MKLWAKRTSAVDFNMCAGLEYRQTKVQGNNGYTRGIERSQELKILWNDSVTRMHDRPIRSD
ncbi:hypothetical protein ABTK20_22880, partial [Acinetobacter baumannii]